jgi:hypothetical protein
MLEAKSIHVHQLALARVIARLGADAQAARFDAPFWLSATHLPLLLASLALFTALGALGWLARRAFAGA